MSLKPEYVLNAFMNWLYLRPEHYKGTSYREAVESFCEKVFVRGSNTAEESRQILLEGEKKWSKLIEKN